MIYTLCAAIFVILAPALFPNTTSATVKERPMIHRKASIDKPHDWHRSSKRRHFGLDSCTGGGGKLTHCARQMAHRSQNHHLPFEYIRNVKRLLMYRDSSSVSFGGVLLVVFYLSPSSSFEHFLHRYCGQNYALL